MSGKSALRLSFSSGFVVCLFLNLALTLDQSWPCRSCGLGWSAAAAAPHADACLIDSLHLTFAKSEVGSIHQVSAV